MLSSQTSALIARIAQAGNPPMHTLSAQEARAFYEKAAPVLTAPPPKMRLERQLAIPNRDGTALPASLWVPAENAQIGRAHV